MQHGGEDGESSAEPTPPTRRSRRRRRGRPAPGPRGRRRTTVVGVLGEIFITLGVLVLLFLGWQQWLNDIIVGGQQSAASAVLAQSWSEGLGTPTAVPSDPAEPLDPPVRAAPGNAEKFGILMVPRWGRDYQRPIAEGIGVRDVLNAIGIGHYPGTQMPGEVGNFAIAAHRMAYGGGFRDLHLLRVGDPIWVETKDGWYRYVFRDHEYVQPTAVEVTAPVPHSPGSTPTERYLTLTTCNPFFSTAERLVGYAVFDTFVPRSAGAPAEIARTVQSRSN